MCFKRQENSSYSKMFNRFGYKAIKSPYMNYIIYRLDLFLCAVTNIQHVLAFWRFSAHFVFVMALCQF